MEFLKMLKKILILSLILNTPYAVSSGSSANTKNEDLAAAGIIAVAGILCTWQAYKDFKRGWSADKEIARQIKILQEMGCHVYKVTRLVHEFGEFRTKEHYTIKTPASMSQEQEQKIEEHWTLLLTNDKYAKKMLSWPAVGSVLLLPAGIMGIIEVISLDFNKN
jgi:hypothetical protein